MKINSIVKKIMPFLLLFFLLITLSSTPTIKATMSSDIDLPSPIEVDQLLETSIYQRMSIREFASEPVTDEQLATILWAGYGLRDDGKRTVSEINGDHAAVIYVLNEEAAYTYNPVSHSLKIYKMGDHRGDIDMLQYPAPIQLGLCWNTTLADPNQAGIELGQIGQNIQFMANALGLGTVVTGQIPPAIEPIGLPENEEGLIVMPLGHPESTYNFINRPLWISPLPKIKESSMSLTNALDAMISGDLFNVELNDQELSQIIWSSYGFSKYIDNSDQEPIHLKRHRTVPSAHGYYPFIIYAVTSDGIYQYYPNVLTDFLIDYLKILSAPVDFFGLPIVTLLKERRTGDFRQDLADITNNQNIASASLILIPILSLENAKELSIQSALRFWYYEAGAIAQNVMLEATAWNLQSKIIYPLDEASVSNVLQLSDDYIPTLLMPVGG